jgi:hypothetical protein
MEQRESPETLAEPNSARRILSAYGVRHADEFRPPSVHISSQGQHDERLLSQPK